MTQLGFNLGLPTPAPRAAAAKPAPAQRPPAAKPAPAPAPGRAGSPPPAASITTGEGAPVRTNLLFRHDSRLDRPELGPDTEVGTSVAARLLSVSPRTIRAYCDEGVLLEGAHWRRNTEHSPYFIRRRALIAKLNGLL